MFDKVVGSVLGRRIAKERDKHPLAAAVIGGVTMIAARRFLPARIALLGGTIAAGYLTKKWAERETLKADTQTARARTNAAGVADINVPSKQRQPKLPGAAPAKKPVARKPAAKPAPKA